VIDLLVKEQGAGTRIWIAAGVTDMRRGFQGLAAQVQTALEQQPYSGHIFIFRGRRGDMVKMLWFDGDGLCRSGSNEDALCGPRPRVVPSL
jgi:transposase